MFNFVSIIRCLTGNRNAMQPATSLKAPTLVQSDHCKGGEPADWAGHGKYKKSRELLLSGAISKISIQGRAA